MPVQLLQYQTIQTDAAIGIGEKALTEIVLELHDILHGGRRISFFCSRFHQAVDGRTLSLPIFHA